MSNAQKSWYISTIAKLTQYMGVQARITFLQEELAERVPKLTANYRMAPSGSGISDQVGNLAQYKMDKEMELALCIQEIRSIDRAINLLGEVEQLVIRTRYLEGNKDSYAWRTLSNYGQKHQLRLNSRDTYYRLKEGAVAKLAGIFGFLETDFQTFPGQKSDPNPDALEKNPCYILN